LQRDLARDIASGIQVTLAPRHAAALVPEAPLTADAYHAHLEGRHRLNSLTPDAIRRSVEVFQRAIAADPGYAPPHASLAEACVMLSVWTEAPPSHAFPMALEAAEHALRLDPALPDAHASLGLINAYYLWDWREAEQRFRTALELNPSCSPAGAWYGEFLAVLGRVDEALSVIDAALRHDPLSRPIRAMRAFALWLGRRFDEAIEAAESVLDLDPAYPMALIRLGVAHAGLGDYAAAVRAFRRAAAAAPDLPACIGLLGYAHGLAGDVREAQAALGRLHRLTGSRYVPAYPFAMVHLGLGELDTAVQFIEQEFENRGWFVLLLNRAPHLDPLRGQARFDALVRRMQFPA
jgi:serine/threonine-protein kinase